METIIDSKINIKNVLCECSLVVIIVFVLIDVVRLCSLRCVDINSFFSLVDLILLFALRWNRR